SLSGTMAISETSLKDVALMTIDEINAKGGVLGKKLEPVVVDPASNWPLFAEKARQLLTQDKVAAVFGCWTSVSRKSVLPVFEATKIPESDIADTYTPFGHSDYQTIVAQIKAFGAGGHTAVISTINGDSNVPFYKELGNQGLKATDIPVVAFSVGEEELRGIDTKPLVGHLAAWNYFMSLKNKTNAEFIKIWKAYVKKNGLPGGDSRVTNDPMEATYVGMHMWAQAAQKAGSVKVDDVRKAMAGQTFVAPSGFPLRMDETNHHLWKPVFIGEVQGHGQFDVVWKTDQPIRAQPWSPFIPGNEQRAGR